jgi:sulfur relay (sulfurtransferase) complex TusBCD TusD component (DsrE family)
MACAALAMDIKATIALQGNAVYLAQKGFAEKVLPGGGFPLIKELLFNFMELGGELKVCVPCIQSRNIEASELVEAHKQPRLEYSSDMIKIAENYIEQERLNTKITFTNGAVENTELINGLGKFDLIYSTFSLHHWNNPTLGVRNLFDALNKNGGL